MENYQLRGFKENPLISIGDLEEFSIHEVTNGDIAGFSYSNGDGKDTEYPISLNLLKAIDDCIDLARGYNPHLICGRLMDKNNNYGVGDDSIQLGLFKWQEGYDTKQLVNLQTGNYESIKTPILHTGIGAVIYMDDNFGRNSKIYIFPHGIIYEEKGRDSILQKDPADKSSF